MKKKINTNKKVVHSKNIIWREVDNEAVILNIETNDYFTLDSTGAEIWKRFTSENSISAIISGISSEYGIEKERLTEDINDFIKELKEEGLVKII